MKKEGHLMNKKILLLLLTFTLSGFLIACNTSKENDSQVDSSNTIITEDTSETTSWETITAQEAKEMLDSDTSIILLDVRSQEEYDQGHIKNALLIPDTSIIDDAENLLTDKSATILVYCRSGRRSALAASDLASLGYTNVYDFGGIIDWPYEVVTD